MNEGGLFLALCLLCPSITNSEVPHAAALRSLLGSSLRRWVGEAFHFVVDCGEDEGDCADDFAASFLARSHSAETMWRILKVGGGEEEEEETLGAEYQANRALNWATLVMVMSKRGREDFQALADAGVLSIGVWIAPLELLQLESLKSRFDSSIYLYNFTSSSSADVSEVFSVKGEHRFVNSFGRWSEGGGLEIWKSHMWERRQGFLKGITLRGCHLPWPPYTYIEESEDKTRNVSFGILPQAIRLLQSVTGFVLEEYQPADGKWGAPVDPHNITGEWNGIVQELRSGRADFGHNPFGTTVERSKVITYGLSIDKDSFTFVVNRPRGASVNYTVFVDIFSHDVWISTAIVLILGVAMHFVLQRRRNSMSSMESLNFFDALGAVASVYLQRDTTIQREHHALRFVHLVNCLCGFLIYAFYTGVLTSLMTATPVSININSFQDILDKDYQPLVLRDSADSLTMENAKNGTSLHEIYSEKMSGKPEFFLSSMSQLIAELKTNKKNAIFAAKSGVFGAEGIVALNLREAIEDRLSPAYPKDSELAGLFNHHFSKLEEAGVFDKLKQKWFSAIDGGDKSASSSSFSSAAAAYVLGYENLLFPVLVFAAGIVLAGIVLVAEKAGLVCCGGKGDGTLRRMVSRRQSI